MGYKEERQLILDDILRNLDWNSKYDLRNRRRGKDNLTVRRSLILERLEKRRPITLNHIEFQEKLEKYFSTGKQYDKFINNAVKLPDFNFKEDFITTKKINLFIGKEYSLGYEKSIKLFNKIISKKESGEEISMHLLLSNMPVKILHPDKWFNFVMKVLDYSTNDCYKCLQKSNFLRVLTAPTKEQIMSQIAFIETKSIMKDFDGVIEDPYMLCKDIPQTKFFKFTKDPRDVSTIGERTFCCFRKGGAAQELVQIALRSPLAATIEGKGGPRGNDTWFSYVWEMIDPDKNVNDNNIWYIDLIFDNIEATTTLSEKEFEEMADIVKDSNIYKAMYCGTIRNDIKIPSSISSHSIPKPSRLVFYDKELNTYNCYDDSKNLYTMFDRKDEKELKSNIKKLKIDIGELNRIAYIIKLLKDSNLSKDLFLGKNYKQEQSDNLNLEFEEDDYRRYEKSEKAIPQFKYAYMTRNTKLNQLDLEKSYILRNNYAIFGCELYDNKGRLCFKLFTEEEIKENRKKEKENK